MGEMSTTSKRSITSKRAVHFRHTRSTRARPGDKERGGIIGAALTANINSQDIEEAKELLWHFDMTYRYGPCVGILRTTRWWRAERLGLDPPQRIKEILESGAYREAIENIDRDLWHVTLNG